MDDRMAYGLPILISWFYRTPIERRTRGKPYSIFSPGRFRLIANLILIAVSLICFQLFSRKETSDLTIAVVISSMMTIVPCKEQSTSSAVVICRKTMAPYRLNL